MKTNIFSFIVAVLLLSVIGCEQENAYSHFDNSSTELRSYEEAFALAKLSISLLSDQDTKSDETRIIDDWFVIEGISTKSGQSDTLVYIFNFADSSGFSIISANPSAVPIIAVTEAGHMTLEKETGIPGFDHYLNNVLDVLSETDLPQSDIGSPELYYYYEYETDGTSVAPLLGQTRWGQTGVYGAFCPNGICGCFATAVGQIMKKFSRPSQFTASCDMSNVYSSGETINLHWNYINYHYTNHSESRTCSNYHNEISAFLRDIGEVASSDYRADETGTYNSKIVPTLQHYGFTSSSLVYANTTTMISSLNLSYPICMFSPGHFYVVDGYKDYTKIRYKYEKAGIGSDYILTETTIMEDIHAMHINWGWNGTCNGYFAFGTYNPANAEEYDTSTNNASHDYTSGAQMVYNIHPIN